jgi:hypothetical protein
VTCVFVARSEHIRTADGVGSVPCTFHIYIADSPLSKYNATYDWTNGKIVGDWVDANAFTVDQAAYVGSWYTEGPHTYSTGMAYLMLTDQRGENPPSANAPLTASEVRLTCSWPGTGLAFGTAHGDGLRGISLAHDLKPRLGWSNLSSIDTEPTTNLVAVTGEGLAVLNGDGTELIARTELRDGRIGKAVFVGLDRLVAETGDGLATWRLTGLCQPDTRPARRFRWTWGAGASAPVTRCQ